MQFPHRVWFFLPLASQNYGCTFFMFLKSEPLKSCLKFLCIWLKSLSNIFEVVRVKMTPNFMPKLFLSFFKLQLIFKNVIVCQNWAHLFSIFHDFLLHFHQKSKFLGHFKCFTLYIFTMQRLQRELFFRQMHFFFKKPINAWNFQECQLLQ